MVPHKPFATAVLCLLLCVVVALTPSRTARADCFGFGPPTVPNVSWFLKDSVAACPSGDSLIGNPHPSRLRISVYYEDANCNPRVGVPPESIGVHIVSYTGNLKANDQGSDIAADDSTDGSGFARITIPSFSGCGTARLRLIVSGTTGYGDKIPKVRSTDSDADGRTTNGDAGFNTCDLNYSGGVDPNDIAFVLQHVNHWHRNALFGTLVKRSTLCDACDPGQPNTVGAGDISWAQNSRWVAFSARDANGACKIFVAPADPPSGNAQQFTFYDPAAADSDDYDPAWSPLGTEVIFDRSDIAIYRKGIKGVNADTLEHLVLSIGIPLTYVSVSPDGKMIAFTKINPPGFHICIAPVSGGPTYQLTTGSAFDSYPKWTPDGGSIIFDRYDGASGKRWLYVVQAMSNPPSPTLFFGPDTSVGKAGLPSYSPDGQIVVASFGRGPGQAPLSPVGTLDATTSAAPGAVINYSAHKYTLLSPRLSADGTRLAELAFDPAIPLAKTPQIWVARRNMSLPPRITMLGTQAEADTSARDSLNVKVGLTSVITVTCPPKADAA